jgi:hypothetical protein
VLLICLFVKAYDSTSSINTRAKELLDEVKRTPFLFAKNFGDDRSEYRKPDEIYIGQKYISNVDLETYFKGNNNIWELSERYVEILKIVGLDTIEKLGSKTQIMVRHKPLDGNGNVVVRNWYGDHKHGLDGFDPDSIIEGLEHALKNITIDKSKIVWEILKKHYTLISGIVESSSRQDYKYATKQTTFSVMGGLLVKYAWLPLFRSGEDGVFRKPCEISLGELPPTFDVDNLSSKNIADKLGFKTPVEQQLIEQLSEEDRNIYATIRTLTQENKKLIVELLDSIKNKQEVTSPQPSISEISNKFKESLKETKPEEDVTSSYNAEWSGLLPEEEETIRKEFGERIADNLKNMKITERTKIENDIKIVNSIDPKEFLHEQYGGHCQICNIRLDLGHSKKPYFETLRLVETQAMHRWTDMEFNVLCLCPNCHALLKHGSKDLKNIWNTSEKVGQKEIAPEPVDERHGDYYIVKITVAEIEREVFYTPTHMAKLSAFTSKANEPQT